MRITLDIPEDLVAEATALPGFASRTDAVIVALRELIRRRRLKELESLPGTTIVDVDIARSRRRPTSTRRTSSR